MSESYKATMSSRVGEGLMRNRGRKAWNELYDLMAEHDLTPEAYLMRIEVLNVVKKWLPNQNDKTIGLMLLVLADSNMREMVDQNG